MIYATIAEIVAQAQRDLQRGVQPREVQARLPYRRAEGSVRRDMAAMWRRGQLVRINGVNARQGYMRVR